MTLRRFKPHLLFATLCMLILFGSSDAWGDTPCSARFTWSIGGDINAIREFHLHTDPQIPNAPMVFPNQDTTWTAPAGVFTVGTSYTAFMTAIDVDDTESAPSNTVGPFIVDPTAACTVSIILQQF